MTNNQQSTNCYRLPSISGLLPIIGVQLTNPKTGKSMEICALKDTRSTAILLDKSFKESLKLDTEDCKRYLTGANSLISLTEEVRVKLKTKSLKTENINCLLHPDLFVGSKNYDYSAHKRRYPH